MFDILFGWPKASKCKKTIKKGRCRLRQLKNKRQAMARFLRKDLAELIQNGHEETAFKRVEQLIQDESLVAAYELLDHFSEFILTQLSYIRRHKDCPDEINEAVSSLIFASARCGDIPELRVIRKLFGQRYGQKFATAAVELFPGNLVNKQLKENLSVKSVPNDLKYKVVDEIARDNCLQPKVLAIEYYPDWQQLQVKEYKGYQLVESDAKTNDTITGSKIHPSEVEEIERDVICVNSSISYPSDSFSLPESCLTDTSALVSTVQQYPPHLSYPLQKKVEKVEDFPELISFATYDLQNKGEIMALVPSAERASLPPYAEAMVDYVDDIDECRFSVTKGGSCQDQRLLKFRSCGQFGCDESDMDQDESTSEKSSIRSSGKSKRAPKKISRRRSALLEGQGIMDIGYVIYYHKPCRSASAHKYGTHYCRKQKKPLLEGIPQSSYPQKRLKQHSSSEKEKGLQSCQSQGCTKRKSFTCDMSDCSLDHPCYCCVYNDQDCSEALSMKPKQGIRAAHIELGVLLGEFCHCRPLWHDESNEGMELVTIPQKPNRESYSGAAGYHLLTYSDYQSGGPNNGIHADMPKSMGSYASTNVSNPRTSGSLTRTETATPYTRALTMPREWPKNCKDKMLRTYSCPSTQPNHVHPKLPDYEDIVAKFTALKKERLQKKDCCREQQLK